MTLDQATKKAETKMQPAQPCDKSDPYEIPFELGDYAESLIGKILGARDESKNKNRVEIIQWIGQNYVIRINDGEYDASPVMRTLDMLKRGLEVKK